MTVEAFLSLITIRYLQDLRGYQVAVDVTGGTSGTLDFESLNIDILDPEFVFPYPQYSPTDYVTVGDWTGVRAGAGLYAGSVTGVTVDYLGTFTFRASGMRTGHLRSRFR